MARSDEKKNGDFRHVSQLTPLRKNSYLDDAPSIWIK